MSANRNGAGGHRDAAMTRGQAAQARSRADQAREAEQRRGEQAGDAEAVRPPALGTPASPGPWDRAQEGADVALHERDWGDARWSFLYGPDTDYASAAESDVEALRAAARDARTGDPPKIVQGQMMKPPVWTWEIPLYFWFGGMASGSSFVALACDLVGDERAARVARLVAAGAICPCPPLLIADLGRPERFYNMLRIFKPRSPMSMGAWALAAFSGSAFGAAGADLLGRRRTAQALGGLAATVGSYFGSYTGILLATTAVPVWSRSRTFLGPIFVATATATGAAAVRTALSAVDTPEAEPTRQALGRIATGAMTVELVLSEVNERRLGRLALALHEGTPGRLFTAAKWLARTGIAARVGRRRLPSWSEHVGDAAHLTAALCFRYAWVEAGKHSARDDEAVARTARARATAAEPDAELTVVEDR
ncbi:MAG: hypothetical protein JWP17_2975 [Solirubrobacterales bacterium]|nr:hypothetical protein [Solirubrobacterales bacterium]